MGRVQKVLIFDHLNGAQNVPCEGTYLEVQLKSTMMLD